MAAGPAETAPRRRPLPHLFRLLFWGSGPWNGAAAAALHSLARADGVTRTQPSHGSGNALGSDRAREIRARAAAQSPRGERLPGLRLTRQPCVPDCGCTARAAPRSRVRFRGPFISAKRIRPAQPSTCLQPGKSQALAHRCHPRATAGNSRPAPSFATKSSASKRSRTTHCLLSGRARSRDRLP